MKKHNKILSLVVLATALFSLNPSYSTEIAVLNLDQVIQNSKAMEKVNKALESKKVDIEKKLEVSKKKLDTEKATIEAQIKTLSQEKAQEKVMAFQQKVVDFQKMVKENENTLQKVYMDSVLEISNAIKEIVEELKTEKNSKYNFDIVVPAASVIYNEPQLDISSEVLSRLNKKLKTVKAIR